MRIIRTTCTAALVATGLVAHAGPAVAATIDLAEVCVDDGGFRLVAELIETSEVSVVLRLGADGDPFVSPVERFQVNFDVPSGEISADAPPAVATFGDPPFDRWSDGPVEDFTLTDLGDGRWRVEASYANGTEPFAVGDEVYGLAVRTTAGTTYSGTLTAMACEGAPNLVGSLSGPATAAPGEDISGDVAAEVSNDGDATVTDDFAVDLVLSSDETVPPGFATFSASYSEDVLLEGGRATVTEDLAPGQTATVPALFATIPDDTPPGQYFLCTRTDPGDAVAESDEDDNVTCTPITIGDTAAPGAQTFDFDIVAADDVPLHLFNVLTEGTVTATIEWTGDSDTLTAELTGRRRPGLADPTAPYAEVTGTSPLTLTYDVTSTDLGRGVGWRLVLRDAAGNADAEGTITLDVPFDAAEQERFEDERIRLRSGDLWPSAARTAAFESELGATAAGLHGIISLSRACSCQEQRLLAEAGFHRQSFLPGRDAFGLVESGADRADPRIGGLVQFLTPLEPEDKIDPHILVGDMHHFVIAGVDGMPLDYVRNGDGTLALTVQFFDDTSEAEIVSVLTTHASAFEPLGATEYHADVARDKVVELAEEGVVEWIEDAPLPPLPELIWARWNHNVDAVHDIRTDTGGIVTGADGLPIYDGWAGAGATVAIHEGGRIDATHDDLANVVNGASDDFSSHKTHVAGIVAGSGLNSDGDDANGDPNGGNPFDWRGIAPQASLYDSTGWDHDGVYRAVARNSADLSNHSYTVSLDGAYDSDNRRIDAQIRGGARTSDDEVVPRRLAVFSAGNNGSNNSPQRGRQFGLFAPSKQFKNAVVVGNWCAWCRAAGEPDGPDNPDGRLARGSSMGPAHDGRLLPTVVAHGSGVMAPDTAVEAEDEDDEDLPGNRYAGKSGTSMASPVVAGVVALLLQAWQASYADPLGTDIDADAPLPSTLRAVLAQTAIDVVTDDVRNQASVEVDSDNDPSNGNDGDGRVRAAEGPDYATGFGEVDAQAAMDLVLDLRSEDGINVPNRVVQGAIGQAATAEYGFVVDTTGDVKVTLAWDDVESATQGRADQPMLVNDLDLELVSPSGDVFYPWRLGHRAVDADGTPIPPEAQTPGTPIEIEILGPRPADDTDTVTIPADDEDEEDEERELFLDYVPQDVMDPDGAWVATRGRDHLNNIEQVLVEDAEPGHWTVRVVGFDVRTDVQDFSLVGMPYPALPDIQPSADDQFGLPALGEDVTFDWTVANVGSADVSADVDYRILLSTDFTVDGSDIELTDSSGPGTLIAADVNAGNSITSTISISQEDADTVLGTSGATVEDLVANDVLLLLEVDPIAQNDVLEHREVNVVPLSPGRLVDVVVVYDRSGSMDANVPTSLGTRRKVEILDDSAGVFFDLMRLGAGDRLGAISFAGGTSTTVTTDFDLDEITASNVGAARDVSASLTPAGTTDIRAALEEALDTLPVAGSDERRRVVVFFSDGEATAGGDPREPSFLDRFPAEDVRVFSVGFGNPGGSSYTGIDTELLQMLGDANAGGFARVTDRPVELDKFFVDALGGAIDWPTIIDPVGNLAPGDTETVDVGVTEEDGTVTFVLTWDDPAGDLELSVETPSGVEIDAGNVSDLGPGVELVSGGAHAMLKVQLPVVTGATEEHAGTWRMRFTNSGSGTVQYSASAIARSTLTGEVTVAEPADGRHDTGDPVDVDVAVSTRGGAPLGGAVVEVFPRVPVVGVGDVLATAGLTPAELAAVPTDDNGDPYTDVERMVIALRNRWGTNPIPLADAPPFTLDAAGGGYAGSYGATRVPGPYTFTVRSSFRTEDCADATREHASTISVEATVSRTTSGIDLTTDGSGYHVLEVTPRDNVGNYVGPGHADGIATRASGTLVAETGIRDRLDGSYEQIFRETGDGTGVVEVTALGIELDPQVVTTGTPVAVDLRPSGGGSDGDTTVAIVPGGTGDPTLVTGVSLHGATFSSDFTFSLASTSSTTATSTGVQATDVDYDPGTGTISATFPPGIVPGTYPLVLEIDDGSNAPSSRASFTVVGDGELPPALQAVLDRLEAVGADTDDNELRELLQAVRSLPTGTFFSQEDRNAALAAVLEALLGVTTDLDTTTVESAVQLAQADAGFFDAGPMNTPIGQDVAVDLGNGVTVAFGSVTSEGTSELVVVPGPAEVDPSRTGSPHVAYDITSTAEFDTAEVTIDWPSGTFDEPASLRMFHLENGDWVDVTTTVGAAVAGTVTGFSPFVLLEGEDPPPAPGPTCMGLPATIVGTAGNDVLHGTSGRDVVVAGAGDDVVHAGDGDDLICAGEGDDDLTAGDGVDIVLGGDGDDDVSGGPGADLLEGGDGEDRLSGGEGPDRLEGGPGDDELDGDDGADLLYGGDGEDVLDGGQAPDVADGGHGGDRCDAERSVSCEGAADGGGGPGRVRGPRPE